MLFCFFTVGAQSDYSAGLDLLINNQPDQAIPLLEKARKGPDAANAAQALSICRALMLDAEGGADDFRRYVALEEDEARRNAFIDAVWTATDNFHSPAQLKYLEAATENSYGRLRPMAFYELGKHYRTINDVEKSDQYFSRIGMPDAWQITGSFENISESGFDRDFGVLAQPGPEAKFTNKLGVPVTWFPVTHLPARRWLYFGNHLVTQNSIVYAQTFVKSPEEKAVILRLGTSGSAKVWVNDQLVFAEPMERDNHVDTYNFAAKLLKGNNRILVQIGASDRTGSNFLLRVPNEAGDLVEGLTFSDEYSPYPKGSPAEQRVLPNPTVSYFTKLIDSGTADYFDYSALGNYYVSNGYLAEARKVYLEALGKYPLNLFLLGQLASVLESLDDDTNASSVYSLIKEKFPESPLVLNTKMSEAKSTEEWVTFEKHLDRFEQLYGKSEETLANRITLAGGRGQMEEVISLIEEGHKKYPNSWDFTSGMAKVLADVRKQTNKVYPLLKNYLERRWNPAAVEELLSRYYADGNVKEVRKLFDQLIERNPVNVNYLSRLSRLNYLTGNHEESREVLRQALLIAPYSNGLYQTMGDVYREGEDKKLAIDAYERALALNPYDYDSRDALRDLTTGQPTAFSVLPEPDYYEVFANSPGAEDYPDDNSIVLNYDVQQIIYPGGASEVRTVVLIKALNTEGVDTWKEYSIGLYGDQKGFVEKVEVLDPDGSRHEGSRSGTDVVFDNLQPGGAIYLVYRLKDFKYGRLSGKFWRDHPFTLSFPVQTSTYSLLVPEGLGFQTKKTGTNVDAIEATKSTVDGKDLYVWQSKNQKAVTPEATMVPFDDVLTNIRVSNIDDWSFIANWYSELTYAKIQPDDYVRTQVETLFAGKSGLSEREEVELIYDFVVRNIRYISVPFLQSNYIPQRAGKTLSTGQGDCKDVSALFVAMCDLRGIDANLVLINTRDRSREALALPGTGFNHCIANVTVEDENYFVELTDENLPFGTGDWSVNNAFGVVIPRNGEAFNGVAGLINPKSRGENQILRTGKVSFSGDDIYLAYENTRVNSVASNLRQVYRNESQSNVEKIMLESVAGKYAQVELTDVAFDESLDNLSNRLTYTYAIKGVGAKNSIGGMDLYEIALSDCLQQPPYISTAERNLPVDLWKMFDAEYYEQTVAVVAPEGKAIVEKPTDTSVSNAYFDYEMTYQATAEGLSLKRTFRLKKDIVAPADYPEFRKDVLAVVDADKVTLAFR